MAITIHEDNSSVVLLQAGIGVPSHISPKSSLFFDLSTAIPYINKNNAGEWAYLLDSTILTGSSFNNVSVTGGTPNNAGHLYTFTNSTGGTFNVLGLTDVYLTGGTLSSGTVTFTNNTGGTFSVTGFTTGSSSTTLYTGDGTLSGNRIVNLSGYTLNFSSSTNPNTLVMSGGNVGVGILNPTKLIQIGTVDPIISFKQTTSNAEYSIRIGTGSGLSSQTWNVYHDSSSKYLISGNANRVIIGNPTNAYVSSTLYVKGYGSGGSNIDAQADATVYDESNIECMKSDYTSGEGIAMRNWGATGVTGTVLGYDKKNMGILDFNNNTNIIRTIINQSLIFGTNDIERMSIAGDGKVAIGLTAATNTLHVSATTDPARFVGLQSASDTNVLTVDSSGTVHTTLASSIVGSATTLYTGDGTLSGNRIVNLSGYTLNFSSSTYPDAFRLTGGSGYFANTLTANKFSAADGSAALPSYTFSSRTDSGMYSIGNGVIGMVGQGTVGMQFSSNLVQVNVPTYNQANSTASSPAERFVGTWYSAGTTTTTKPHLLIEENGAISNTWDVNGGALGINSKTYNRNHLQIKASGVTAMGVVTTTAGGNATLKLGSYVGDPINGFMGKIELYRYEGTLGGSINATSGAGVAIVGNAHAILGISSNGIFHSTNGTWMGKGAITNGTPTALVHIPSGTTAASTASVKIDAGQLLVTTEGGAIEHANGHLFFTDINGGTRYQLDQQSGVFVTGGTYNNPLGTATFTNNTGGTFSVTGFSTGSTDGVETQTGDGFTTVFNIPHGLGGVPSFFMTQANSIDAAAINYVDADSTNIIIHYLVSPPNGSNLVWTWTAKQ